MCWLSRKSGIQYLLQASAHVQDCIGIAWNFPGVLSFLNGQRLRSLLHETRELTRQALCVERNIEGLSCNHCCGEEAINIKCRECVFVSLGIQHAMRMRHIFVCGLSSLQCFSTLPHKRNEFWNSYCTWNLFLFSVRRLSQTLLILRRRERGMIINVDRSLCRIILFRF